MSEITKKDTSLNKHNMKGLSGQCVSASKKATKQDDGIILIPKSKLRIVELEDKDTDFDCYD